MKTYISNLFRVPKGFGITKGYAVAKGETKKSTDKVLQVGASAEDENEKKIV